MLLIKQSFFNVFFLLLMTPEHVSKLNDAALVASVLYLQNEVSQTICPSRFI